MSTPLENRVTLWVSGHPGSTAREVALGVHASYQSVAAVLKSSVFEQRPREAHPADRAQGYWLVGAQAPFAGERPRDAESAPSQSRRILEILVDGRWHSSASLHASVFCVLHSRVAELRRRGHVIECRHIDGAGRGTAAYEYRLIRQCEVHPAVAA